MFRQLATRISPKAIFKKHPIELTRFLERAWEHATSNPSLDPLGHPEHRSDLDALPPWIQGQGALEFNAAYQGDANCPRVPWDHLIYAYMIENTRVYEIFRRVIHELVHGEKLGTPRPEMQNWLRATEELFYRDSAPFTITSVMSHIRPDLRANRRNAYQRMFGMELNHGSEDGKPYPYIHADAANNDFVATFEEFLREVWVGMIYVTAISSSNPTDPAKIALLAHKLHDMLLSRRQHGNLSREEFSFVSAMSWFHLTLEFDDSPIIASLRAEATGVDQRLFKIAERVGLPAHGLCKHFFEIASPLSWILIQIEMGDYNDPARVPALYTRVSPSEGSPEDAMRRIITHWTAITGRDVKARKVAPN